MNRTAIDINRQRLNRQRRWGALALLLLSFDMPAVALSAVTASPQPGAYCPSPGILLVTAEELSTGLQQVMRSRAALMHNQRAVALNDLAAAGTALQLAASRGAAARTNRLVDAVTEGKPAMNYTRMLTWFPLLHSSLRTLPDDESSRAADNLIARAEELMQRKGEGEPLHYLGEARHMLACDDLDIPLQAGIQAQSGLLVQLGQRIPPKPSAYDALLDSLRNALSYCLRHSER